MQNESVSRASGASFRPATLGLCFAVLTLLFGQGLGVVFGLNEDLIKSGLKASTVAVRTSIYRDDDVATKAVLDKSWGYFQRAHLHAGGMGTTAVVLIVLVGLLGAPRKMTSAIGVGLGAGQEH